MPPPRQRLPQRPPPAATRAQGSCLPSGATLAGTRQASQDGLGYHLREPWSAARGGEMANPQRRQTLLYRQGIDISGCCDHESCLVV